MAALGLKMAYMEEESHWGEANADPDFAHTAARCADLAGCVYGTADWHPPAGLTGAEFSAARLPHCVYARPGTDASAPRFAIFRDVPGLPGRLVVAFAGTQPRLRDVLTDSRIGST